MTKSPLEHELLFQIRAAGLPEPEREYRFDPDRKWRVDLAYPLRWLALEIEGGTWIRGGGRHNRAAGFERDCEKYNALALAGFRLLRFTGRMIRNGSALNTLEEALRRFE